MNAIIASALLGVLMMFASWIFDNEKTHTRIALVGLLVLIVANVLQLNGIYTIPVDYKGLLAFTQFGLYVNTILFILTFLYVWLNGDEIAKIGNHAADFYALFFFGFYDWRNCRNCASSTNSCSYRNKVRSLFFNIHQFTYQKT